MSQEGSLLENDNHDIAIEISDDIEVVGPGKMLSAARTSLGMSQQQVADKLNFRIVLVQGIEAECFDKSLPDTFNRGYLRNYAKLVNISPEQVLVSYEQLGIAQKNCAELQSFSKGTEKRAEHNRVMWISYLILAVLVGATFVWWQQTPSSQPVNLSKVNAPTETVVIQPAVNETNIAKLSEEQGTNKGAVVATLENLPSTVAEATKVPVELPLITAPSDSDIDTGNSAAFIKAEQNQTEPQLLNAETGLPVTTLAMAKVVFTFSEDCWVNIYDATGERIAWGVKKSGYVMTINGQAPFTVTLGKPELVTIDYNGVRVDTSTFSVGNIAKFALPIKP